jgi:hypothetical protein
MEEETIMPFADPVLRDLDDVSKLGDIRSSIIRTIRRQLQYRHGALDEWEIVHFTNAITSLALNVDSLQQPTAAWLRLCLVDLETALLLPTDRIGPCQVRNPCSKFPSHDELISALDKIVDKIERLSAAPSRAVEPVHAH